MRRIGWAACGIGLVLAAGIGGGLVVQQQLDPEMLRQSVIASVEKQSGRTMTLGHVAVRVFPTPRVDATDLALAGRPGDTDPEMLRIGHLQAGIGIWPLLRHVVRLDGVIADHLALHVVRDADGHGNWEMGPKSAAGGGSAGISHARTPWGVELGTIQIDIADLSLRDAMAHRDADLHLLSLNASGLQGGQPHFGFAGSKDNVSYEAHGVFGPVRRLFDAADRRTAWPVSLEASETSAGAAPARITASGSIADPLHLRGYDLAVAGTLGELADLNRLFPHAGLPQMQGLDLAGHVVDDGHPSITMLQAKAGATTLPDGRQVTLQGWSISAPTATAPVAVAASGSWRGQPLVLKGTVASLEALNVLARGRNDAAAGVLPVRLDMGIGTSAWKIEGTAGAGASDVRLQGFIPDMGIFFVAAPDPGQVTLGLRLQVDHGRQFRMSELHLVSGAGDLDGALTLASQGRLSLSGQLHSDRIDLDRLLRRGRTMPASAGTSVPDASPGAGIPGGGIAVDPEAADARRLPWAVLRAGDADLSLEVGDLLIGGNHYREFQAHAVSKDGRLLVEPVRASGPAGTIAARLQADASVATPTLRLWMHPVMLPAPMLAGMLGAPDMIAGAVELVGDLQATGETRSALAQSATGHVGLSVVNGSLSNAGLTQLLGKSSVLAAAVPASGKSDVRCLAVHAAIGTGEAMVDTLSLRTRQLALDGHGRIGLADGVLDLHLVPDAVVGGASISLPMRLQGTLQHPQTMLDVASSGGRYALTIGSSAGDGGDCRAPLQVAREGVAGPAPAAASQELDSQATPGTRHKAPKAIDILRGLGILH